MHAGARAHTRHFKPVASLCIPLPLIDLDMHQWMQYGPYLCLLEKRFSGVMWGKDKEVYKMQLSAPLATKTQVEGVIAQHPHCEMNKVIL